MDETKKEKEWEAYFCSDEFAAKINEAIEDIENGRYESYDNIDDFIASLESIKSSP